MSGPTSQRTQVNRLRELQQTDRAALDEVLDAGNVAHVAVVDGEQPYALPMAYVRDDDRLLLHGSTGSRLMRLLAEGAPACATVTLYDGLVVARSAFESSMHYRSAMVLGRCQAASDPLDALRCLTDGLLPGRWAEVRPTTGKELAGTLVVELPIDEWSVKVSGDDPEDPPQDVALDIWAGVLPASTVYGAPRPSHDLRAGIPIPPSVRSFLARVAEDNAG
ncbi:MAG TPA: pyridoxamine 5'-phosphate oxidase family protein [Egibacteraceae bacterium]|nr:pyridoxamine 5'-phosphate oxidase family protein [Egibacteraceae bacterium]